MDKISDIIILGGGPVGLYGAFYSGIRSMSCTIIDSLPELGGQLTTLYPKKYVYDVPGFTKVLAQDLAEQLIQQATQFDAEICLNEKVVKLEYETDKSKTLKLTTHNGTVHRGRSVVIAAGAGAFLPRKLDVNKMEELEGHGLYYTVKNPDQFKDKDLIIIGGGDSAIDWALSLEPIAKNITLIHRSERFRAHEDSVHNLFDSNVSVLTHHELKALHGEDHVEGVTIFDNVTGEEKDFKLDTVLCNLGFMTNLGPIKEWGFELDKNTIHVSQTMNTNLDRVWAAGDIVDYPGKLKLISTGFAEAAIAINMAKHTIEPNAKLFPGHSSSKAKTFKF
ncbi:MAG: ferredoxin--NADP reductase 2 [bacterium]|nr:MAG: ferredoxin--NADP reductase 2 [bacterium]